ncbi:hypothetical protein [Vibrio tritonius]
MQTSELHQRAQVKFNDGRNGHSLSTSLGAYCHYQNIRGHLWQSK